MRESFARLLFALVMIAGSSSNVIAHKWFTDKVQPGTRISCCGGSHCKVISNDVADKIISPRQDGYQVNLSQEQASEISDQTMNSIRQLVPWSRVQPSEESGYAICIIAGSIACFFAPISY